MWAYQKQFLIAFPHFAFRELKIFLSSVSGWYSYIETWRTLLLSFNQHKEIGVEIFKIKGTISIYWQYQYQEKYCTSEELWLETIWPKKKKKAKMVAQVTYVWQNIVYPFIHPPTYPSIQFPCTYIYWSSVFLKKKKESKFLIKNSWVDGTYRIISLWG